MDLLLWAYRKLFVRRSMYAFNKLLFSYSLRGLGILNWENNKVSGEDWFLNSLSDVFKKDKIILFDVGANVGNYAHMMKRAVPGAEIYSFEPHPVTFQQLRDRAKDNGIFAINSACGDMDGIIKLYDYKDIEYSCHASIYEEVFDEIHKADSIGYNVEIVKIDTFCRGKNIDHIDLLKIDTEGHELKVLQGAIDLIKNNAIDLVQLEFNEMNVVSRSFFKDFVDILHNYTFYRLLPDGLVNLGAYNPLLYEIYAFQNVVAVRKGFDIIN
jgi:FkbM family methyltransferase